MSFSRRTTSAHAERLSATLTSSVRRVALVEYSTLLRSSMRFVTSRRLSSRLSAFESMG